MICEFELVPQLIENFPSEGPFPCPMYTASFAFFEALWEAGVSHCFVNLGSDHPSIIEAIVKGQNEKNGQFPRIVTCPNEVRFFQIGAKKRVKVP
ncbi:MAG: hypothetical protein LQ347_005483 [Umbilicaria vellea]|nr:MAG: hypothetical protein LQ347_005483 [Umbilicaria vellea]